MSEIDYGEVFPETSFGRCNDCGQQTNIKKTVRTNESLCGDCWAKRYYILAMERGKSASIEAKRLYKNRVIEDTREGEFPCQTCGESRSLMSLNADGLCGDCQRKLNNQVFKVEEDFEIKRKHQLRKNGAW